MRQEPKAYMTALEVKFSLAISSIPSTYLCFSAAMSSAISGSNVAMSASSMGRAEGGVHGTVVVSGF